MKNTYRVLSYSELDLAHECIDQNGTKSYIDLMVDGGFPEGTTPESLVGNTYEAEYDFPYVSIAMGVNPNSIK